MPIPQPIETVQNATPAAKPHEAHRVLPARTPETFVKFEAMVLQTFMQSILPKDTETVYGGGLSGDMWKSMLAQQLGEVMAQRGGIGIADRILGDHYLDSENRTPAAGISQRAAKEETDRQSLLSTALVERLQREAFRSVTVDLAAGASRR